MNFFHLHHRLLFIFILFIVSTLGKIHSPSPGPSSSSSSTLLLDTVPEPKKYPTLSSFFPSLIRVGKHSHKKAPLLDKLDPTAQVPTSFSGPGPWPSPSLQPVSSPSPVNVEPGISPNAGSGSPTVQPASSPVSAEPEMSPISAPFPQDGPEIRLRHRKVPSPLRSYAPAPGPSPTLQPVLSSNSPPQFPDSPPMDSKESPEGPDGDRSQETQSDEQGSNMEMDYSESEAEEEETGNAIVDVKKVCETTDHPSLCINTVNPLLVDSKNNNVSLNSVLGASINATDDIAKAALLAAKKIAHFPGTPPELASVLEVCEETYGTALDNFDKAKEAYDTQDIGTMNTMLSAVISNIEDCNTEFSSLNLPLPAPIAEFGDKLRNMTSNCLAIVSLY